MLSSDATIMCTSSWPPRVEYGLSEQVGSIFANGTLGDLYLLFVSNQNEKGILLSRFEHANIKAEGPNQFLYSFSQQPPRSSRGKLFPGRQHTCRACHICSLSSVCCYAAW